jgi:hypothetical protein
MPQIIPGPGAYDQDLGGINTIPAQLDVAVTETYPYKVDCSNYMSGSDALTFQQVNMFIKPNGQILTNDQWYISNSIAGNVLTIFINCGGLRLGWKYQLQTTISLNTNKVLTFVTNITVVA